MKVRACISMYIHIYVYVLYECKFVFTQSKEFTLVYLSRQTLKGGYPVLISCCSESVLLFNIVFVFV